MRFPLKSLSTRTVDWITIEDPIIEANSQIRKLARRLWIEQTLNPTQSKHAKTISSKRIVHSILELAACEFWVKLGSSRDCDQIVCKKPIQCNFFVSRWCNIAACNTQKGQVAKSFQSLARYCSQTIVGQVPVHVMWVDVVRQKAQQFIQQSHIAETSKWSRHDWWNRIVWKYSMNVSKLTVYRWRQACKTNNEEMFPSPVNEPTGISVKELLSKFLSATQ
jgi:hypothetical protein